jgi:predicted O-linked N-acetylglucosamine transferase (SPINDLY family)
MAIDLSKPMSLHQQGRFAEAVSLYDAALKQEPNNPDALYLTGLCRLQMGDMERGARHMRTLVKQQPQHAAAQHALGKALLELGKPSVGKRHLEQALAINPTSQDSRIELAELALAAGDAQHAESLYRDGLNLDPSQAALWNNIGTTCRMLGKLEEAEQAWVKTISLAPNIVEAYCNIATLKVRVGRFSEGITYLQTGLDRMPDDPDLNFYHGELLFFAGKFEDSATALKKATALRENFRSAEIRLAQASQYLCDWDRLDTLMPAIREEIDSAIAGKPCLVSPFFTLTLDTTETERTAVAAAEAGKREAQLAAALTTTQFTYARSRKDRIHVGYLSGDWRDHAASHLACGLFQHHDREKFEISVLSYGSDDGSDYRRRIKEGAEHFIELQDLNDIEAARAIHERDVDILIDVQGFMGNARPEIWMLGPAPIQVSYLTYLGSMGADKLQYVIADKTMISPDNRDAFAEAVITLPNCYQVNDDEARIGTRPTRADEGLPDEVTVFCAMHGGHKITRDIFKLWMRILTAVPDSVLWLAASGPLRLNLCTAAQAMGIDPSNRLVFAQRHEDKADHMARLTLADLYLDTPIYGAHSSAVDCLWAGTPVLSSPGPVFSSRGVATLLNTMGISELITRDFNDYEKKAIALGHDPASLKEIVDKVSAARSLLFNTSSWVRDVERAYAKIWAHYCDGKSPEDIGPSQLSAE